MMGTLCPKGLTEHEIVNAENRVAYPMVRKDGKLTRVGWDEAYRAASDKFKRDSSKATGL